MDHITNFFEDVKDCTDDVSANLKGYRMLNYAFNLMKCFILYKLGTDISAEAAYIQFLFFVTVFFLYTLSLSRAIRVLLAQCFWILTAHILRYHFLSNAVMPMIMILDEDVESVMSGVFATRVFQLIFQYDPEDQDLLCIRITAVFVMIWYTACCSKSWIDLLFGGLIVYSYNSFCPKMTDKNIIPVYKIRAMCVVLSFWVIFAFLVLKQLKS